MFNLAYMVFEKPLKKRRTPFTVNPFGLYQSGADYNEEMKTSNPEFGGDAKVPIGYSMNADLPLILIFRPPMQMRGKQTSGALS